VEVTWRLGDHYVSQGSATVQLPATPHHEAGIYDEPDVASAARRGAGTLDPAMLFTVTVRTQVTPSRDAGQ
jgi:hypothetical protein